MANNRIYLRCAACGEHFFLGKRLAQGYWLSNYHPECGDIEDQLNVFYNQHVYCKGNGEDCFEIEYEMDREFDLGKGDDRLTRWEGRDEDGPRAVLVKRDNFNAAMQEALRKLAKYEDTEETPPGTTHSEPPERMNP